MILFRVFCILLFTAYTMSMSIERESPVWMRAVATCAALILIFIVFKQEQPITLTGVVIRQDPDPSKQESIADVEVTAAKGVALHGSKTDSSGLFHLRLFPGLKRNQPVELVFRHPDYKPETMTWPAGKMLYVVRMSPRVASVAPSGPSKSIAQVSIRYSVKNSTTLEVGSVEKTFAVANTGNIRCSAQGPCSPDEKWKATIASMSLDAGQGNEFRNSRVSCIAGPCPFAKLDSDGISEGGRVFNISVRDWSDPVTFLVEAEVVHPMTGDSTRELFPAILGRDLNFTVPAEAQGVSIEAEVDGTQIVFPLGPDLCLSWAQCSQKVEQNRTSTYRCELKPGYTFR